MIVAVSGSTGLIGNALVRGLHEVGHKVLRVLRNKSQAGANDVVWDLQSTLPSKDDLKLLEGLDAFVHLAGENIASGRWTEEKKKEIRNSRVMGTDNLVQQLSQLNEPPGAFLCASAIGFYGDRGSEMLNESSSNGASDFLSEVCRAWENSANKYQELNPSSRVVNLRFGVVLSKNGGALASMITPFKLGLGGPIGSGRQFMSWIDIDDAVNSIIHCIQDNSISGPVNIVAPNPVTNQEYTKALGSVISRPTMFPMPDFAARLVFGQMADELLLSSAKVIPKKLNESKLQFKFPQIQDSLSHILT